MQPALKRDVSHYLPQDQGSGFVPLALAVMTLPMSRSREDPRDVPGLDKSPFGQRFCILAMGTGVFLVPKADKVS